jgi:Holliday junction DNA helicase RuvA
MIARLEGVLIERNPPKVIVDCAGVGYEVTCSSYTLAGLPSDGERVVLRVYTHTTRDAETTLFGFGGLQERGLFDLLITVKNVGPSTAIAMLSGSTPRDLAQMIAEEDVAGLTRIKGVGKKTAELTVVELHEKCAELALSWDASGGLRPAANAPARGKIKRHPMLEEVSMALVGLGWRPAEAEQAVADLPVPPDATTEQLLRQALRSMPR